MVVSDEALLAGMAGGDEYAASAFVRRYQARVYGLALTIVGAPALAEDVAQESFVKAWRHAATYDARRGRVSTWLLTITRNTAIDAVRYRHDAPMDPDLLLGLLTLPDEGRSEDDPDGDLGLREALGGAPARAVRPHRPDDVSRADGQGDRQPGRPSGGHGEVPGAPGSPGATATIGSARWLSRSDAPRCAT